MGKRCKVNLYFGDNRPRSEKEGLGNFQKRSCATNTSEENRAGLATGKNRVRAFHYPSSVYYGTMGLKKPTIPMCQNGVCKEHHKKIEDLPTFARCIYNSIHNVFKRIKLRFKHML